MKGEYNKVMEESAHDGDFIVHAVTLLALQTDQKILKDS